MRFTGYSRLFRVLVAILFVVVSSATVTTAAQEDGTDQQVTTEATTPEGASTPEDVVGDPETSESTDTPESTTPDDTTNEEEMETSADESGGSFGPMAIDPETGSMVAPTSVHFTFPADATFSDLAVLSVTLDDLSENACQQGSPRFAIGLADDVGFAGYAFAYLADVPSFSGCTNVYASGANLVGTGEARWEVNQVVAGSPMYMSWGDAESRVGDYTVTELMLVVDAPGTSLTPVNPTVQFKMPPQELLGDVIVNVDFDVTPDADTCFELVSTDDTVVGEQCLDDSGSIAFEGISAGEYTVRVSDAPEGYVLGPESQPVTVTAGENSSVSFSAISFSVVTIELTSADPEAEDMLPEGATWEVQSGTQTFSDEFAAEHLQLPATILVESPLPVGQYTVTIDAGPNFEDYSTTITLNQAEQTVEIELEPAQDTDDLVQELLAILLQILEDILAESGESQ